MKLKYEDKKEIYRKWKNGERIKKISEEYLVDEMRISYLLKYIDKYGIESVEKGKNTKYSKELKKEIINKVLLERKSALSISLEYGLSSTGMLSNWIATYKKNGYTIVEKTRGRPRKMGRKPKKKLEKMTELERLKEELEFLRTENAYLKKLRALRLKEEAEERGRQRSLESWSQEGID